MYHIRDNQKLAKKYYSRLINFWKRRFYRKNNIYIHIIHNEKRKKKNTKNMSAISEETMEIFKYIGDLTSIHSTSYALRLLNDSTYMQQLLDQNNQSSSDLHELISYLIRRLFEDYNVI